ncbi:protein phosphatase 2C domain-containing protein [uncultured Actinomyces sp.]|uniref:protein phosphatase 2C domain-containing protein n=1 Tax=uncultured Actinomyces sp. TaxID=249061 RepID=UPI002610EDD4|nr:protein phosphatase 2C domain-containing protein [uncultured Actinomyces sp.]
MIAIGPPGRAANEIGGGVPPAEPWPPDIAASEYEVGPFAVRAGSVRGILHRHPRNSEPRQDAYGLTYDKRTRTLIVVVCDGVGEFRYSHEAAAHVCRELPWYYLKSGSWNSAFFEANNSLMRLVESWPGSTGRDNGLMATTAVAAAVSAGDSGISGEIAWVGDSQAWVLDDESVWHLVAPVRSDQPDTEVVAGHTRALPSGCLSVHTIPWPPGGRRVFLMSDGVGTPLEMSTEVQKTLAEWWGSPPDPYTFVQQVGFARQSFMDDRTAVGIWIDLSDAPEGKNSESNVVSYSGLVLRDTSSDQEDVAASAMVSYTDLEALTFTSDDSLGEVFRTGFRLPGYRGPLVYKQLRSSLSQEEHFRAVEVMRQAVRLRDSMSDGDRSDLDEVTVWPLALVEEGGVVRGCLMPLIHPEFSIELHPLARGRTVLRNRDLVWLCMRSRTTIRAGFSQDQVDEFSGLLVRMRILVWLVYSVALLHSHGVVYGDINLRSAVFCLGEHPRSVLTSCDRVARLDDMLRRQANSPFFLAPECEEPGRNPFARGRAHFQDTRTDVYKLGLCVVRCLSRGHGATQLNSADHLSDLLSPECLDVVKASLSQDPDQRPTAKQLYQALNNFVQFRTEYDSACTRSPNCSNVRNDQSQKPKLGEVGSCGGEDNGCKN